MSDINTLDATPELDELDLLAKVDLTKEASEGGEYPPPIPAGDYLLKYDLGNTDLDKVFVVSNIPGDPEKIRKDLNDGLPYLTVKLIAEVADVLTPEIEEPEQYIGRKVFAGLNLSTLLRNDGTTKLTNWLKSVVEDPTTIPGKMHELRQFIIDLCGAGEAVGQAHVDWEAYGKSGENYLPDWGFFKENKKAAKGYPRKMTEFPQTEGGAYEDKATWTDPRTNEEVQLKARAVVTRFYTKNPKVD